jgi:hypothetical protein
MGPSFFGSWFPFPDNRGLDWERFGKADFLYISHRHRDHFDPALLERYVPKDIRVLLPEYPTTTSKWICAASATTTSSTRRRADSSTGRPEDHGDAAARRATARSATRR